MPNKAAIVAHVDDVTDECKAVGACNTVFVREATGRRLLCVANTGVAGVRDALSCNVADPTTAYRDRSALVIRGGGGAARSAVYALRRWTGLTETYMVNRDPDEADALVYDCARGGYGRGLRQVGTMAEARGLQGPGVVVACVPDAAPRTEGEMRSLTALGALPSTTGAVWCWAPRR